jgi:hypothetical protein
MTFEFCQKCRIHRVSNRLIQATVLVHHLHRSEYTAHCRQLLRPRGDDRMKSSQSAASSESTSVNEA